MTSFDFSNRHIVVTGGTGALGSAVVDLLVHAGATCHIPAHQAPPAPTSDQVRVTPGVDLADESAVTRYYDSLPPLWASIHTAGAFAMGPLTDTSLAQWKAMQDANALSCFLTCREAVKRIRASASASRSGGRIVNVAAKPALVASAGLCAYAASKAVVASLTVSLAEELAAESIWVNAVIPSTMDTPANRRAMPRADASKWPSVADVAATIAFLASPQNAVTRGALVPVYGRS
ncbi:MAG: SDR family NAD(P)-dependent oxidoreductase [Tepidisphaeraceae bacterium]